jgi:hypothetical protein
LAILQMVLCNSSLSCSFVIYFLFVIDNQI